MSQEAKRSKVGGWPLAVGISAVLVFLFFIRTILLPFVLAAAAAFLLTPAIDWAHRRFGVRRWIVGALIYVLVLAILGLLLVLFGGLVMRDLSETVPQLPQIVHRYVSELVRLGGPSVAQSIDADDVTKEILAQARTLLKSGAALSLAGYGIGAVFGIILSLVVLVYFLISGRRIAAGVFWLVPPEYRREVDAVAAKILPLLWRYFVGLLAVVTYTSILAWIAFGLVFGLPHAPLLAVVVGVLELIPVIGPAMTFCIVGVMASQHGGGIGTMIALMGFAAALRLSIDELVAPLALGKAVRLHPVVIIFAFLSGGILFGVIGLLLAVPVAASIKIILTIYYAEPVSDGKRETG
jgi:predicted PurR-regulated permease PerM